MALSQFYKTVVEEFGGDYERSPTEKDLERTLAAFEDPNVHGSFGGLDCDDWSWSNFPKA